jgi:hypothetical protein
MAPASVGPLHHAESCGGGGAPGNTKLAPSKRDLQQFYAFTSFSLT